MTCGGVLGRSRGRGSATRVGILIFLIIILFWGVSSLNLRGSGPRRARSLRVIVVEEHHEVLPYWHSLSGPISVLHVDAHEDTAPPSVAQKSVNRSMSSNDVFVFGSVLMNKLKAFTWIWPAWDVQGPRHSLGPRASTLVGNSGMFLLKIGVIRVVNRVGVELDIGCLCMFRRDADMRLHSCEVGDDGLEHYLEGRDDSERQLHATIHKKCRFTHELPMQQVSNLEVVANRYHSAASLSGAKSQFVLDIDEDFFGVLTKEDAKIMRGGLSRRLMRSLDHLLAAFQVSSVEDEDKVNDVLRLFVHTLWNVCWNGPRPTPVCWSVRKADLSWLESKLILFFFESRQNALNFVLLKHLAETLLELVSSSPNAAHLINSYGFCLSKSPATSVEASGGFMASTVSSRDEGRGMKFCVNDASVYQVVNNDKHPVTRSASSSPYEVARRLGVLRVALGNEQTRPALVTVCRSVRDGYTHPHMWPQIEEGVLKVLRDRYGELDVHYDRNLMGGRLGWAHHARVLS